VTRNVAGQYAEARAEVEKHFSPDELVELTPASVQRLDVDGSG